MGRSSTGEEGDPIVQRMPRLERFRRVWIGALAAVGLAVTACASGPTVATASPPATVQVSTTPPPVPGAGSCSRPSHRDDGKHGIELEGKTTDNEPLTVLLAGVHHRIPAGRSLTTYVRVGGVRALRISVIGTDGHVDRAGGFRPGLPPFDWPGGGTPWTGRLTFPHSGCWRVHVQRGGLTGELWLHAG